LESEFVSCREKEQIIEMVEKFENKEDQENDGLY
jgi:hypothetical protein